MPSLRHLAFTFSLAIIAPALSFAAVKLPPAISDHMVLQRGMQVPIWGTSNPGEPITVKFRDQQKTATADKDGRWIVKLDALKPGGPDELTIASDEPTVIKDVLVGDVWVGSGQSNMSFGVTRFATNDPGLTKILASAPYPKIRIINGDAWKEAVPANLDSFSALLLSFGVSLQKEIDVPVGLMLGARGGTPSGAWLTPEMFAADEHCQEEVKKALATYDAKADEEEQLAAWQQAADKAKAAGKKSPEQARFAA